MSENQPENALHIEPASPGVPPESAPEPVSSSYAPVPAPDPAQPAARQALRTRTVVFGLILLVIAGCVLAAQLTSVHVDPGAVALGLMVVAGLLLIAGGRGISR